MNSDFWKRFPTIPGFDCLKMKHDIQAKIHEETKHMTQEQRLEYYRSGAKKLRRCGRLTTRPGRSWSPRRPSRVNGQPELPWGP